MTKYIVIYRMNDKVVESKKYDSMMQAILEQMKLDQFGISDTTIHLTTDGETELEYGMMRLK